MNKSGQVILDLVLGFVMLFVIAVCMVLAVYFHSIVTSETDIYSATETGQEIESYVGTTVNMFNFIFVMCIAAILVSLVISAHYIETSTVFLVVGVIILGIIILISAPISNSFQELTSDPDMAATLTNHTLITTLMNDLPLTNLLIGSLFLIVLYAKKRKSEGGAYSYLE